MKKILVLCLMATMALCFFTQPADAARSGGTLNFIAPYGGDIMTMDPQRTNRVQDFIVTMSIHRGLFKWDAEKSMPVPDLAESVQSSEDGLVHTFKLRNNIKFHNGRQLTVDDLIWSYERIIRPAEGEISLGERWVGNIKGGKDFGAKKAEKIEGLKKIDDLTIEITLADPIDIGYALYDPSMAILPKEEVEKAGKEFGNKPVGCGPFKLASWTQGSEVVLEKFDGYYEEGLPYLNKVVYRIMPEGAARDLAFRAKDLDATLVGSTQYPQYQADPEVSKNLLEVAEMFTRHIGFHAGNFEPFKNQKVRQAINYAIDSNLIIEKLLKNKAFPCRGFLPTTSPAFDPKGFGYTYDPKKAKELMKEAGFEKGFEFECVGTNNEAWGAPILEALIPFLKEINVTIKPLQVEEALMADRVDGKNDIQAYIWSYESGPDPLTALKRWTCDVPPSAGNSIKYCNPDFDNLIKEASAERDVAKRLELLKKADAIFTQDAPMWFFNYNKAIIAHQPWVHGLQAVAVEMMYQDMTRVWVDENSPRAQ